MKTYEPSKPFITPPENGGQMVTESWSIDFGSEVYICRVHDGSDGSIKYEAFAYGEDDDAFEPWNGVPDHGPSLGQCRVDAE